MASDRRLSRSGSDVLHRGFSEDGEFGRRVVFHMSVVYFDFCCLSDRKVMSVFFCMFLS